MTRRYFECHNCGTIHYGITQEEADKMNGYIFGEFNERNLKRCGSCGSSYPFFEVSEAYVDSFSQGGEMYPWLYPPDIDDDEPNQEETINT